MPPQQQQPPPYGFQQTFPGMPPYGFPPPSYYAPPPPQPVQQDSSSLLQFQMMQLQQQQQQQRFDDQLRRFKEETARQSREAVETLRRENAQLLTEVQRLKERHVTPKSSRRPKTPVVALGNQISSRIDRCCTVTASPRWRGSRGDLTHG